MAELLTREIVNEYRERLADLPDNCNQDIGERRKLRKELQLRCGLTEVQAINVINGHHMRDVIAICERRQWEDEFNAKYGDKVNQRMAEVR